MQLRRFFLFSLLISATCLGSGLPNIIFIFADDMGYGDVSCLNPESKFKTPHLGALAAGGLTLSDAHALASVFTPS